MSNDYKRNVKVCFSVVAGSASKALMHHGLADLCKLAVSIYGAL